MGTGRPTFEAFRWKGPSADAQIARACVRVCAVTCDVMRDVGGGAEDPRASKKDRITVSEPLNVLFIRRPIQMTKMTHYPDVSPNYRFAVKICMAR